MSVTLSASSRNWIKGLQWAMVTSGVCGLIYCLAIGSTMLYARRLSTAAGTRGTAAADAAGVEPVASPFAVVEAGGRPKVVGRIEIPAIGLTTPLMSGDDSMSLAVGAGHIPGTAVPGGLGTVGIAGHRDTNFRLLRKVGPGMEVRLVSPAGMFHYRVVSSEIVLPEQVSVLATGEVPGLALVTCYPFQFIGHAPKRFIVHAELVSVAPDER